MDPASIGLAITAASKAFTAIKNGFAASAIEAFTAKKKLEAQRQELKSFINFHYGANSWNEILHMEAEIRKKRKEEISERQEMIRKIWEYIGWTFLFCSVIGFIIFLAWLYKESR